MARADDEPIPFHAVLLEELEHQRRQSGQPGGVIDGAEIERRRAEWETLYATVAPKEDRDRAIESGLVGDVYRAMASQPGAGRTALCLSGGGIRSATFALGVVQGLARRGLLGAFDYLSTVSGGGYLGSWLSGWIAREKCGVAAVERALSGMPATPLRPDPEPVFHLREYSRYMSPQLGLLSADTWTLVAIFLRNLILNWLILVPLLAAVLLVPRVGVLMARQTPSGGLVQTIFWLALGAGIVAIAFITTNRPSLTSPRAQGLAAPLSSWPLALQTQKAFLWMCLMPLAAMAIGTTLVWYWTVQGSRPSDLRFVMLGHGGLRPWLIFMLFGVALHVGGFVLSRFWVRLLALRELFGVALSGALGGLFAWWAADAWGSCSWLTAKPPLISPLLARQIYVCAAAPLLLFLFVLAVTIYVALASKWTSDADREWVARAAGWILIWVVARAFLSALVIFGPKLWYAAFAAHPWATGVAGGGSSLLSLILGFASQTGDKKAKDGGAGRASLTARAARVALALAAPLCVMSIVVGLSALTSYGLRFFAEVLGTPLTVAAGLPAHGFLNVVAQARGGLLFGLGAALVTLGLLAGNLVDINRFSLHGAYRDRLIRAYLGASREPGSRQPNRFSGFDDRDNLELTALAQNRPFHVVNVALNLVNGKELAWQDRKAESFTFSALHCGYRGGYRSAQTYGKRKDGGSISLGTALAISGAAASPNMGSHSSPMITFLLALFNIRLGWWLGNPGTAGAKTFAMQGPREAPRPLAAETFGLTNDQNPYVYLSDGGHFENLGLYEMVLRRCRFIVVSDAGQDPKFQYEDLGNAIAKIRIDLGVPIDFCGLPMRARTDLEGKSYDPLAEADFPYYALARIRYSCVDGVPAAGAAAEDRPAGAAGGNGPDGGSAAGAAGDDAADRVDGWLLYLKPALNGTEPADVFHYAKLHTAFPHESTGNQLYSEAQFESYRALGSHAVESLAPAAHGNLPDLFEQLWQIERRRGCRTVPKAPSTPGAAAESG